MRLISLRKDKSEWINPDYIIGVERGKNLLKDKVAVWFSHAGKGMHGRFLICSDYDLSTTLNIINGKEIE